MKKALITGIAGQDGSYLAEHLVDLGYDVHGTVRCNEATYTTLEKVRNKISLYYADLRDETTLEKVIRKVHPDELYNLAGQVFVPTSWDYPAETFDVNTAGLARILKIVERTCQECRVYQASSSEMYGNVLDYGISPVDGLCYLDENTPMRPVSPYGTSKYASHCLMDVYRRRGLYTVSGILFNHESPRRGTEMVTRKISHHVARWYKGDRTPLKLGNIQSLRDWGFAGDYVRAMHAMLQQQVPDDYVVGTGKAYSVKMFLEACIKAASLPLDEYMGLVQSSSPEFNRKNELFCVVANRDKARTVLNWAPTVELEHLAIMMVDADIMRIEDKVAL